MASQTSGDTFGKLPDEILCRIIAFLPPETTLETTFLSTRWRALWDLTSVQKTTIDAIAAGVSEFAAGFRNSDPLGQPRKLKLWFGKGNDLLASLASSNKLKLVFSMEDRREFPTLFGCELKLSHRNCVAEDLCPSDFYVKSLYLKSFGFLASDLVSSMVSSFHFLERLTIAECSELKTLRIEAGPRLSHLAILDCRNLESLDLKCPKLRSFRYRGKLPRIQSEYHFNLVDAMLDFRHGLGDDSMVSSDFDPALLTVKNARVLTLCSWTFETLIWPSLCPLKENFQFYKLKELWWIGYSEEICNTDSLIHFLKLCPALERLFITIDPESYRRTDASACPEKSASGHIGLSELRVVKMEGVTNSENEIRLMDRIREIYAVDPLVIISVPEYMSGNLIAESPGFTHAHMSV